MIFIGFIHVICIVVVFENQYVLLDSVAMLVCWGGASFWIVRVNEVII